MTQFKGKGSGQEKSATAGLFVFPVLQAADILLYRSERIPVGEDQRQHLELTRDLAVRFNTRYGEAFAVPEPIISAVGARIMNLQDPSQKMSKSAGPAQGVIQLTDPPEAIQRKIRTAVTDSGCAITVSADKPTITNLLMIYSALVNADVHAVEQAFAGASYEKFKNSLADVLVESLRPIRESHARWMANIEELARRLQDGASRAKRLASHTLRDVYERVGLMPQQEIGLDTPT